MRLNRPLDRLGNEGIRGVDPVDLLALALSPDPAEADDKITLARGLLVKYGINLLGDLGRTDLMEFAGVDEATAIRILAAVELGRRSGMSGKGPPKIIKSPQDAYEVLKFIRDEHKEHFVALLLNSKGGLIGVRTIHIGTVNLSVVGPREVFREAVRENAVSVIVGHNHPSGDPTPSPEDINITHRLRAVGEMLDIPVLDHVVVASRGFVSLVESGMV
jgi:DNA repair protein RadC